MPKWSVKQATAATVFTTYRQLEALYKSFINGGFSLVAVQGRPGLGKSHSLKRLMGDKPHLLLTGTISAVHLFEQCYYYRNGAPVILDNANLMSRALLREYVKALTETDKYRRMEWGTRARLNVPALYFTSSPVCIISNAWNNNDPILKAIESRAQFVYFNPSWEEVYKQVGKWFWDQQIYDYVRENIRWLKEPNMEIFKKAWHFKAANNPALPPWKQSIDHYKQPEGSKWRVVAEMLEDTTYNDNHSEMARVFQRDGYGSIRMFKYYLADIKAHRPADLPKRIILKRTRPPVEQKPQEASDTVGVAQS